MRVTLVETLISLIDNGEDIYLITADLGFGLFEKFIKKHPKRFINVGVCEANMIGVAAGMALRGKRVFCYSISPFSIFRPLDQIRSDLCSMNLPVTIISAGGGVSYGFEGMTHYAIEDIAITRALPNLTVMAPADPVETKMMTEATVKIHGPCYLRLGGKIEPLVYPETIRPKFGTLTCLQQGEGVAIIANGTMVKRSLEAIVLLNNNGINCGLYSLHTIKPLDSAGLQTVAKSYDILISIEEHSIINGIGTAIAEVLLDNRFCGIFLKLGLPDEYPTKFGSRDWMRDYYNLSPESIAKTIKNAMNTKDK